MRRMPSQAERSATARTKLIEAAIDLGAKQGVGNTSVAAIADHAGLSRGSVNFHFGSKDELLSAVAQVVTNAWEERAQELTVDPNDSNTLDARLAAAFEEHVAELERNPQRFRIFSMLLFESLGPSPHLRAHFAALHRRVRDGIADQVAHAQRSGNVCPTVDPDGVASALVGAFRGISFQYLLDPDAVDLDKALDEVRCAVVARLAATAA